MGAYKSIGVRPEVHERFEEIRSKCGVGFAVHSKSDFLNYLMSLYEPAQEEIDRKVMDDWGNMVVGMVGRDPK